MKLHRFILPIELPQFSVRITDTEVIHQIHDVLRLGISDMVILSNGKGQEAQGTITDIRDDAIEVALQGTVLITRHAKRRVLLACAILKRENFELVAQKAVEVGVAEILPVVTARTIKKGLRLDRLQKIMREAAEQSGQPMVAILHEPMEFVDALEKAKQFGIVILLDERGNKPVQESIDSVKDVVIFIGPEGGFTEEEVIQAKERGATIATLSPFTLRAETAAITASFTTCSL